MTRNPDTPARQHRFGGSVQVADNPLGIEVPGTPFVANIQDDLRLARDQ